MNEVVLNVSQRESTGKGGIINQLRLSGMVPGVIYGHGSVSIEKKDMEKYMKSGSPMSKLISMCFHKDEHKGECDSSITCILRDVQYDAVTDEILHVDFQKVAKGQPIKVKVPVKFFNQEKCVAIKRGAVMNTLCSSILLRCMPESIPQSISVDVADMLVNKPLHINDISLPEGVEKVDPTNFTLAVLAGVEEEGEAGASAGGAE